jgi:hypothetical protein
MSLGLEKNILCMKRKSDKKDQITKKDWKIKLTVIIIWSLFLFQKG